MAFPAVINLSSITGGDGSLGFAINGVAASDFSGVSVSSAGDVNGDGFDDVLIGAHGADPNRLSGSGQTYVVFGKAGGFGAALNLSEITGGDGSLGFAINGLAASDVSGYSVSSAGDVNGDGFDDVLIGAYQADPNGLNAAGQSYVVFGKAGGFGAALNLSSITGGDGSLGFAINGVAANIQSGFAVSSAGDVNGDGFDDVVIGAYLVSPNGLGYSGQSYVVFGKAGGFGAALNLSSITSGDGSLGFAINGVATTDYSGYSVSSAGDVNGDGFDDVLIGAVGAAPNGLTSAGQTYVVFGKAGGFGASLNLSSIIGGDGSLGFAINGTAGGDQSGISVSSAGDVNGDGFDDVLIGANGADPNGLSASGQSYVVFGKAGGFGASLNVSSITGGDGSLGFAINGVAANGYSGYSVSSAGDVNGDGADDLIIGATNAGPNGLAASGQSYVIFGQAAAPTGPGAGDDTLTGDNAGADTIDGLGGDDSISGLGGADSLLGGDGNDTLDGGDDADELDGGAGNDSLLGGAGGDHLAGKDGDDVLSGGDGDDNFYEGAGSDTIDGGAGADRISYRQFAAGLLVTHSAPGTGTVFDGVDTDSFTGVEHLLLGTGADTYTGSAGNDSVTGGAGDDLLDGGAGDDTFFVRFNNGVDTIIGGAGADTILAASAGTRIDWTRVSGVETVDAGGFGNVNVTGSAGADVLNFVAIKLNGIAKIDGGAGNDTITGSAANDTILGGDGDDVIQVRFNSGTDVIQGGAGVDTIKALTAGVRVDWAQISGIEVIDGDGRANVQVAGSGGADTMNLSAMTLTGVAKIDGGAGNDTITGTAGNDTIYGGNGADLLRGGAGADSFAYLSTAQSGRLSPDRIADFVHGTDRIDLSAIDGDGAGGALNAFTFIGAGAFTGVAGQLRVEQVGGDTLVLGDTNGDAIADLQIILTGNLTLDAADFML